uniref:Uncharacterized protein n=1 Tax=Glossina palpalis gambiensis TaxID=67801 RepID=A0A1B0B7W9_9MUSC
MASNSPRDISNAPLGKRKAEDASDFGQDFPSLDGEPSPKLLCESSCELSQQDTMEMSRLAELPPNTLLMEIKEIYEMAYELGIQEAQEFARAQHLAIFNNKKKKL